MGPLFVTVQFGELVTRIDGYFAPDFIRVGAVVAVDQQPIDVVEQTLSVEVVSTVLP